MPACLAPVRAYIFATMERALFFSATAGRTIEAPRHARSRYAIGEVLRHRVFDFRGVVFDIDPVFANTEEWYQAIPAEMRPRKDQPFYHLLAENAETEYIAYVSEQNLLEDDSGDPVRHPQLRELFERKPDGRSSPRVLARH